jgi:hypothetical protein
MSIHYKLTGKIFKFAQTSLMLLVIVGFSPANELKAESPAYDPWYYVKNSEYKFAVPDKFQHFYGSALITEIAGPMPALAFGIIKEVHDDVDGMVGFSARDVAADMLGIISAKLARDEKIKLWLDWNAREETLILNFGINL